METDGAGFDTTAGAGEFTLLVGGATLVTDDVVGAVFEVVGAVFEVVRATVTGAVDVVCDTAGAAVTTVLLTLAAVDDVVVVTTDVFGTLAPAGKLCAATEVVATSKLVSATNATSPVRLIQRRPVRPLTASSPDRQVVADG